MSNIPEPGLDQLKQIAEDAFRTAPSLYVNGFIAGLGFTDVYVVFQTNGRSSLVMNLPLPVTRTLGETLLRIVAEREQQTGEPVPGLQPLAAG